ncbi:hypothetical protein [Secundilactobacillus silagei]|uniref:hypothetical protein n=1 Tax=Secundilactobacillus silagei TaxID=1293415 RepID=UPI002092E501|nr:hypothetical protein [Secundilactobacillus silagei]
MLKRYIRPLSTLLTLALITILLVGCTSKTTATHHSHQINVVASLDFYGETAKAVLGDKARSLQSLISPVWNPMNTSPRLRRPSRSVMLT